MPNSVFEFNQLKITPISDGHTFMPNSVFSANDPCRDKLPREGMFQLPISAFLVQGFGRNILIDTGSAGNFGPDAGRFCENLAATGLHPDEIDTIFLTHLHSDHYGGLRNRTGGATFPKARLALSTAEWRGVYEQGIIARMSDEDRAGLKRIHSCLEPYSACTDLVDDGDEIMAGLRVMALPGHTAGHCGLVAQSGTQELFFVGDLFHNPAYQLANPSWSVIYDDDLAQAARTRIEVLSRAAKNGTILLGAHLGSANFMRIEAHDAGFRQK
jgi:glyoxylase-like metal-dependent hydrolase (beta-lactamase superfamily II)